MKIKTEGLAELFESLAKMIREGDSFEGSLSYSCMVDNLESDEYEIKASLRTGNSFGQGGVSIIESDKL